MILKLVLLTWSAVIINTDSASGKNIQVMDISQPNLFRNEQSQKLGDILKTDGAFAFTGLPKTFGAAVSKLDSQAADCLESQKISSFKMADGSMRTTYAAPPSDDFVNYPDCIKDSAEIISDNMDTAYTIMTRMLAQLVGRESLLWKEAITQPMNKAQGFENLLKKEHIHVYHPQAEAELRPAEDALSPHQDNGIILLLTHHKQHPVQIYDKEGLLLNMAELEDDAIIIIVGRALPSWLLFGHSEGAKFHPATHFVPSLTNTANSRTVFARMMTAPLDAVIARPTRQAPKRFRDVFLNEDNVDNLCLSSITPKRGSWEEFQHTEACPEGYSYCWMNCLVQPDCPISEPVCLNSEDTVCCTDPSQEGTGTCVDMDGSCKWSCP